MGWISIFLRPMAAGAGGQGRVRCGGEQRTREARGGRRQRRGRRLGGHLREAGLALTVGRAGGMHKAQQPQTPSAGLLSPLLLTGRPVSPQLPSPILPACPSPFSPGAHHTPSSRLILRPPPLCHISHPISCQIFSPEACLPSPLIRTRRSHLPVQHLPSKPLLKPSSLAFSPPSCVDTSLRATRPAFPNTAPGLRLLPIRSTVAARMNTYPAASLLSAAQCHHRLPSFPQLRPQAVLLGLHGVRTSWPPAVPFVIPNYGANRRLRSLQLSHRASCSLCHAPGSVSNSGRAPLWPRPDSRPPDAILN